MTWEDTFKAGAFGPPEASLLIDNLRGIVTGRLGEPPLNVRALRIEAGRIAAIGDDAGPADMRLDAQQAIAIPGLIDTHSHVVFGDYSPRQHVIGWIESYMHGGVTQLMSASEVHLPGRPRDREGVKALAIVAQRAYMSYRPGGVKVNAGSVICEPVLTRSDFVELAKAGVHFMKVGFGAFADPRDAAPLVKWAQEAGFVVMSHSGGASIPGSQPVTAQDLLAMQPDIAGHVNGGTTALPDEGVLHLIDESRIVLQLVQAGNLRSALLILKRARERNALDRVILGTDTPSGTGVMPLGLLKTVVELSSLGGLTASDALALATGNAARAIRVPEGILDVGCPADIVLIQEPRGGTQPDALASIEFGDIPAIAAVIIDGQLRALRSRNSPAPSRPLPVGLGMTFTKATAHS
jgi:enamidase